MSEERVGLCPGTFDPITMGHMDIIRRAVKLVDRLVIGVLVNPAKVSLFGLGERVRIVSRETEALGRDADTIIDVLPFEGLLVHFAEKVGARIVIRGLRAVSDFEYEYQMVGMNSHLNADIETVFLMADGRYQAIASRLVKEVAMLGGCVSDFVTAAVERDLMSKVEEQRASR